MSTRNQRPTGNIGRRRSAQAHGTQERGAFQPYRGSARELSQGEVRRGTVDDLSHEIEQIRNNPELLAFLAERSQEKETFSLEDVKRKLGL